MRLEGGRFDRRGPSYESGVLGATPGGGRSVAWDGPSRFRVRREISEVGAATELLSRLYCPLRLPGSSSVVLHRNHTRHGRILMRCARCDRPLVSQAVGWTVDGLVVFGWCLDCLKATDCRDVQVARPRRRVSTMLDIRPTRARFRRLMVRASRSGFVRKEPTPGDRRWALGSVALAMAAWGVSLVLTGVCLALHAGLRQGNALGQGSPVLMLFGGGMSIGVAAALGSIVRPPGLRDGASAPLEVAQGGPDRENSRGGRPPARGDRRS